MTGPAHQRLTQVAGYADGVLDLVTPALLPWPTPCRAWNLGMLLDHLGESLTALCEGVSAHCVALSAPAARDFHPDAEHWSATTLVATVRRRAAVLLHASAQADSDALVSVGGHSMAIDCLLTVGALEIAVHAWDVAQACGQPVPIPAWAATDLLAQARVLVPPGDRAPLFAAPAPVSAQATPSDQLIAYLGRALTSARPPER
jgi:uncharacterized protein (TIGR03086 family)